MRRCGVVHCDKSWAARAHRLIIVQEADSTLDLRVGGDWRVLRRRSQPHTVAWLQVRRRRPDEVERVEAAELVARELERFLARSHFDAEELLLDEQALAGDRIFYLRSLLDDLGNVSTPHLSEVTHVTKALHGVVDLVEVDEFL